MIFLRPLKLFLPILGLFLAFSAGAQTLQSIKLNSLGANLDCSTAGVGSMFFVNDALYFCNTNTGTGNSVLLGNAANETISATLVTSGDFGSLAGGGNYSFPGSLGVGITSPAQPLHVAATSALPATSGTTQTGGIRIVAGAAGAQVLDMGVYNTTGAAWLQSTVRTDLSQNFPLLLNPNGGNVGIGTAVPGANLEVGTTTAAANVISRVLTADGYNAGFEAYGASQGTGYLFVGQGSTYGGGIFYNGDGVPAFATGEAADRVSFFRKNSSANEVVFSYSYINNVVDFRDRITIGYPSASTDAARKDYVDNNFAPLSGASGVWKLSSNNLYASSTAYNVGIGTTAPASKFHVAGLGTSGSGVATFATTNWWGIALPDTGNEGLNNNFNHYLIGRGTDQSERRMTLHIPSYSTYSSTGTRPSLSINSTGSVDLMRVYADTGDAYIKGNVGIGTTTPGAKLTVHEDSSADTELKIMGQAGYDPRLYLKSEESDAEGFKLWYDNSVGDTYLDNIYSQATQTLPAIRFRTNVNGTTNALVDAMTIIHNGNVGIGTTTPATELHVYSASGNAATFNTAITVGYPSVSTDAARKDYVDTAIGSGSPTAYATSSGACNVDATCEMQNADFGGSGNITGVGKLTVTTIDPLYQIKGKKYSTYASAIVGGVKEEYVGRGEMKQIAKGKWQMAVDFDQVKDGSDLWVWRHAVDFSENSVEVLVTPIGVPVPVAYEIKGNKIIFFASSESINPKSLAINFSYRLIGKRFDWVKWPTLAEDQNEKAGLIVK